MKSGEGSRDAGLAAGATGAASLGVAALCADTAAVADATVRPAAGPLGSADPLAFAEPALPSTAAAVLVGCARAGVDDSPLAVLLLARVTGVLETALLLPP